MAFVIESERKISEVKPGLGPGAYFSNPDSPRGKDAYAPFLSTSKRASMSEAGKLVPPGPGQYQVSTRIVQPIIQTLSNSHSIIVKINSTGTVPFKSGQDRFTQRLADVPGPGSYTPQNDTNRSRRNRSLTDEPIPNSLAMQHIRDMNKKRRNPTIPNRITSLTSNKDATVGPKETRDLELERGPGKYHIPGAFGAGRGSLWGKDNTKRFDVHQEPVVGPGKYTPGEGRKPEYKYNPSSTFISDTVRTHFDNIYFKTNQNFKAKIRMKSHYKAPQPGPGQYDYNVSAIDIKSTPFPYQFFGSSVERFQQSNTVPVGPGIYKLPSEFQNRKIANKVVQSFNATGERDTSFLDLHTEKVPGPGAYTDDLVQRPKLYAKSRKTQMFGVTEKRFEENREVVEKPGPGAYFDQDQTYQTAVNSNRDMTGGIFKSGTSRQCFGEPRRQTAPQVGYYDVRQFDLSSKVQKQKIFIENLKKIDVEKAPFDSSNSRFPHYEDKPQEKENQTATTTKNDNRPRLEEGTRQKRSRSVATSPEVVRPAFMAAQKRFADMKRGAPSVGVYQIRTPWDKKSFNVKYQQTINKP